MGLGTLRGFLAGGLIAAVAAHAPAAGSASESAPTRDLLWQWCSDDDPALSIKGCTAIIASGRERESNLAQALLSRGIAYRDIGQRHLALEDFNRAIALSPDYARALGERAFTYQEDKEFERAIADYEQALRVDPSLTALTTHYADALYGLGYAELQKGRFEEAALQLDRVVEVGPSVSVFLARGHCRMKLRRYDDAVRDYDRALELNPGSAPAYYGRGVVNSLRGRYEKAIKPSDGARVLLPPRDPGQVLIDNAIIASVQLQRALKDFDRAVELDPNFAAAVYQRGVLHIRDKNYDLAVQDLTRSLNLRPGGVPALVDRGIAQTGRGDFGAALSDFEAASRIDPTNAMALYGRGVAKRARGDVRGGDADVAAAKALQADVAEEMAVDGLVQPAPKPTVTGPATFQPSDLLGTWSGVRVQTTFTISFGSGGSLLWSEAPTSPFSPTPAVERRGTYRVRQSRDFWEIDLVMGVPGSAEVVFPSLFLPIGPDSLIFALGDPSRRPKDFGGRSFYLFRVPPS